MGKCIIDFWEVPSGASFFPFSEKSITIKNSYYWYKPEVLTSLDPTDPADLEEVLTHIFDKYALFMLTSPILSVIILIYKYMLEFNRKQHYLPTSRSKFGQPYSVSRIFFAIQDFKHGGTYVQTNEE